MKKLMMIAAMMLMSVGAFAQDGKFAIGANIGMGLYGNEYNPFGFGAKFQYEFVEDFRAELAANYWLPKDEQGLMDFNLNLQYLIPITEGLRVYPLVGVNLAMTQGDAYKILFDSQQTLFGFQGGAGIEYFLSENLKVNFDIKYQYNKKTKTYEYNGHSHDYDLKFDGPVFQAGIAYVF